MERRRVPHRDRVGDLRRQAVALAGATERAPPRSPGSAPTAGSRGDQASAIWMIGAACADGTSERDVLQCSSSFRSVDGEDDRPFTDAGQNDFAGPGGHVALTVHEMLRNLEVLAFVDLDLLTAVGTEL